MTKIADNIRHLRNLKNLSQEALADDLNITRARLGAYEEGRNEPPIEMLIRLSDYFHVAIDALVKANLQKTDIAGLMKIGDNRLLFPIVTDKDNNDTIEVVTAKASAGYLNGYADPEYIGQLPLMNLPFRVAGKNRCFPIKGDSMPPLQDGSFVIGKYVESLRDIKDGNTYILVTRNEGLVYKRVYHGPHRNSLELHSDNTYYHPYKVKAEDILEVWEFVCCLNLNDKKEDEINPQNIMNMLRSMQVELESIRRR